MSIGGAAVDGAVFAHRRRTFTHDDQAVCAGLLRDEFEINGFPWRAGCAVDWLAFGSRNRGRNGNGPLLNQEPRVLARFQSELVLARFAAGKLPSDGLSRLKNRYGAACLR